jgi:hypothetical protein
MTRTHLPLSATASPAAHLAAAVLALVMTLGAWTGVDHLAQTQAAEPAWAGQTVTVPAA